MQYPVVRVERGRGVVDISAVIRVVEDRGWTAAAAEGWRVGRAEAAAEEMAADAGHHGRGKLACSKPADMKRHYTYTQFG